MSSTCSIQLRDWVAEPLRRLTDRHHKIDGLNCWGSTLFLRGLRDYLFYAHDAEFTHVIEQACSAVQYPQAGDIGAIRRTYEDGRREELHAFVYLTGDYAISKHSYSYESELEITRPEKFFAVYGDDVTYYRCAGWRPPAISEQLNQFAAAVARDYWAGHTLENHPLVDGFYLPLIEKLNQEFFFNAIPMDRYALRLFESAVWQYTYLYSGERTRSESDEI